MSRGKLSSCKPFFRVSILKGNPKYAYLQPIANKVKIKLVTWKDYILAIVGRVPLIKTVVQNMILHYISIYSWPVSLLKDMEMWLRNSSGLVIEIGLRIRDLSSINEVANIIKLCLGYHSIRFATVGSISQN